MAAAVENATEPRGFSPVLGWSHYQVLMGVENPNERLFYEIEAEKEGWEVAHLKRQIHTLLFARLLKSRDKAGVMQLASQGQVLKKAADAVRNPYILDFNFMYEISEFFIIQLAIPSITKEFISVFCH